MLAFSIKRYLPTRLGIITLECGEVGYLYVGQKAYNSGVLLSQSILDKGFNYVEQHMKPANAEDRPSVKEFYDKLPNPLKPLALLLYNTEKEYVTFEEQVGVLDIILQSIYPTAYFNTPKNQRISFEFGRSIESEYRYDWENFFNSCIDYDLLIHPKENREIHPIVVVAAEAVSSLSIASNGVKTQEQAEVSNPVDSVKPVTTTPIETSVVTDLEEVTTPDENKISDEVPEDVPMEELEDISINEEESAEDFLDEMLKEDY